MGKIHVYVPLVFGWVASAIQGYVLDSIAVTTWKGVKERVDVFALTDDESGYTSISHKYHTPYGWEPWEGKFENLGRPDVLLSPQRSAPTAISWSTDDSTSINLFIVDHWGKPWHRYWYGFVGSGKLLRTISDMFKQEWLSVGAGRLGQTIQ